MSGESERKRKGQPAFRRLLHARLQARRPEIELAMLARVYGVSDPTEVGDPEYVAGLREAVSTAIDYGLSGIERGEVALPPIPPTLLVQARHAARNGVSLDTVLRRYFAGYSLLSDFMLEEAESGGLMDRVELKRLLQIQATLLDRLLAAVGEEYAREADGRVDTVEERRAERVQRLLDGEFVDVSEFAYDLEGNHVGAIARGQGALEAIRDLAKSLDCRVLAVRRGEGVVWVWFGSRRGLDPGELARHVSTAGPPQFALAIGEPLQGLGGWRLTHQQARAAMAVALRSPKPFVHYADVALLASMLQDDLLARSLHGLYLAPLEQERDGGEVARKTLRAYFAAERNVSSAAAALGVNRHTVASRLRAIEERLGRSLSACATDMEAALRLGDLAAPQ